MSLLVNVATANQEPFYVDAQAMTAIVVGTDGITMFMTAEGMLNSYRHELDLSALRTALAQSGHSLLTVTTNRHLDQPTTAYISTAAITFATVSEPDTNGTIGAIMGVKGLGWINEDLTHNEWTDILTAMHNTGRPLLSFDADQAHARWTNAKGLYIYPDAITQMTADGDPKQLNIGFVGSGQLDVQVFTYSKRDQREHDLYTQWADQQLADSITTTASRQAQRAIADHVNCEIQALRSTFARQLAQSNGTLIAIQDGTVHGPIYMSRKDIGAVVFGSPQRSGDKYTLLISAASRQGYEKSVVAYFNERAQRDAAFDSLQRQLAAPTQTLRCAKPGPK